MESYESQKRNIAEKGIAYEPISLTPWILDQMREDGYTIIEPDSADQYPGEIRYAGFEGMSPIGTKYFNALVAACRQYLHGYIVTDAFGNDHHARTPWRNGMFAKYGAAYTELNDLNVYRLNKLTGVMQMFDRVVQHLDAADIHTKESDAVRALAKEIPPQLRFDAQKSMSAPYNNLPGEEKMAAVNTMKGVARAFLKTVIKTAEERGAIV